MKKIIPFLILSCLLSCSKPKKPQIKRVDSVQITNISNKSISVQALLVAYNPNYMGGTITKIDIDVLANGIFIGKIIPEKEIQVPRRDKFQIPLNITVPFSKINKNNGGLLGGIISVLANQKINMEYHGNFTFELMGMPLDLPFEHEEVIKIQ